MFEDVSNDLGLMTLSLIVAVWGAYLALGIMGSSSSLRGSDKKRSLFASVLLLATSSWSMHFIVMLSYSHPFSSSYDFSYIALSFLISIIASIFIVYIVVFKKKIPSVAWGGCLLSGIIVSAHYVAMLSLTHEITLQYEHMTVVISLVALISICIFALYLMRLHVYADPLADNGKKFHLRAALALGMGLTAVQYLVLSGVSTVFNASIVAVVVDVNLLFSSELALLILFVLSLVIALVPLFLRHIELESCSLIQSTSYWLIGIFIFGLSMTALGQWYMSNAFHKGENVTQIGYRIESKLFHLQYLNQQAGENVHADVISEWSRHLDETHLFIQKSLHQNSVTAFKKDGHIGVELQVIMQLLGQLKEAVIVLDKSDQQRGVDGDDITEILNSISLLSEDILNDIQSVEQRNKQLFSLINGANVIWFILVFSSVAVIMRRRYLQLEEANKGLNNTLSELQRQKYAIDQHAIVAITNSAGCITYVNDAFCNITHYSRSELLGQNHRIINSDYHTREFWQDLWRTISSGKVWQGEIKNKNKEGAYYWVYTTIVPFLDANNRPERYLSMRTEITATKQAELDLLEKEYWMNSLIQALPDEILLQDADEKWLIANDVMLRNLGLMRKEYQGLTSKQLAEKSEILKQRLAIDSDEEHILRHDDLAHWELEYPTVQGEVMFDVVNVPLFNDDASRKGVVRVGHDISVRKRMEEENQMLASAIFQAEDGMFITDSRGILEYVNPAYEELLFEVDGSYVGQQAKLLRNDFMKGVFFDDIWSTLNLGETWSGRCKVAMADPSDQRDVMISISPIYMMKGIRFVGVLRDVTNAEHLETRLLQAEKMESIGRLAGGIAHDFNNILTAIIGYSELVMDDLAEGSYAQDNMTEIQLASHRAKDLVKQILTFSRRSNSERQTFEAESVIKEAIRLIRATIPASISIEEKYLGRPMMLEMDPTQLHQVIMNLSVNAAQALNDLGQLSISTQVMSYDEVHSSLGNDDIRRVDFYLLLTVKDNGPGIPTELQGKVFEPFYTTKPIGSGTGMGLAAVHGIVTNNGGAVHVHNNSGKGACFEVYLPLIDSQEISIDDAPVVSDDAGKDVIGTILFVDDEVPLTDVVQQILTRQGFRVDTANDPLLALELFKADPEKYDVVVSDKMMPNMSGDQLASSLFELRSDIPFILCSGHSDIEKIPSEIKGNIQMFIRKPLDFKVLGEVLQKIIELKE